MFELLIATENPGKIRELRSLLGNLSVRTSGLDQFPSISTVIEDEPSFALNAAKKAAGYALQTNMWAVADDSGLEVPALGNAPGVFSARYSGENASDPENIEKLLFELELVRKPERSARFVCEMAVSDEEGVIRMRSRGVCRGMIGLKPLGNNGFGYDPVFVPEGFDKTFGELTVEIKAKISHRSKAAAKIVELLGDYLAS